MISSEKGRNKYLQYCLTETNLVCEGMPKNKDIIEIDKRKGELIPYLRWLYEKMKKMKTDFIFNKNIL